MTHGGKGRLAGTVGSEVGHTVLGRHRRDIHDESPASLLHEREKSQHAVKSSEQVDIQDTLKIGYGCPLRFSVKTGTGIVDQNVDEAQAVSVVLNELQNTLSVRHIAADGRRWRRLREESGNILRNLMKPIDPPGRQSQDCAL